MWSLKALTVAIALLLFPSTVLADNVILRPDSITAYLPSLAGNATVAAFYGLWCVVMFFWIFRTRSWWALCEPIGAFFSFLGFVLRIVLRTNQSSQGVYIAMYLFVVLSPACFLAFNYIVYGRLLTAISGINRQESGKASKTVKSPYSPLPPRLYTTIFVISDVVTFLIQAAGGGMQTSHTAIRFTGNKVFLAGIILQLVSYIFFTVLMLYAHIRLVKDEPKAFSLSISNIRQTPPLTMLICLYFSSIFIIVRNIFRSVEMAQGYDGTLYTTEIYTMLLDAMPLLLAVGIWVVVWPSYFVDRTHPLPGMLPRLQQYGHSIHAEGHDEDSPALSGGVTGHSSPANMEKESA